MASSPANKRNHGQKSNGQQAKSDEKGCTEPPKKSVAHAKQVQYQAGTEHQADAG
jgi:hypothetical protein